jgi:hypothetical protein
MRIMTPGALGVNGQRVTDHLMDTVGDRATASTPHVERAISDGALRFGVAGSGVRYLRRGTNV